MILMFSFWYITYLFLNKMWTISVILTTLLSVYFFKLLNQVWFLKDLKEAGQAFPLVWLNIVAFTFWCILWFEWTEFIRKFIH